MAGKFTALVAVQGTFNNAKGNRTEYTAATGGALIYPSMSVEGTESATRHVARLMTQRRVSTGRHDETGAEIFEDLEAAILVFPDGISMQRYHGGEAIADFLTGREFTVIGKLPSAIAAAATKAKRRTRARAATASRKRTAEITVPVEAATVS